MTSDRIQIDDALLRNNVLAFLKSPAGAATRSQFDVPLWACLLLASLMCVGGICALPTIIWTMAGVEALWSLVRLQPFRTMFDNPAKKPETLQPLICHGIIIGPDQRHSLVLGAFDPPSTYSSDWLSKLAVFLAEVYRDDSGQAEEQYSALRAMLREDTYHPNRRRRVPNPLAEGLDLFLFDVEVDLSQAKPTPFGNIMFAFVATRDADSKNDERGEITLLPWAVANDAVRIS